MTTPDDFRSSVILADLLAQPQSEAAFRRFTSKYHPRILDSCKRLNIQDADADDIAARILMKFYEDRVFESFLFQSKDKFNGWLSKVVRNEVCTFLRDRGRQPGAWSVGNLDAQALLDRVAEEEMIRDLTTLCAEDRARAEQALDWVEQRVDPKTMQAFRLTCGEGLGGAEVAARLGMSVAAVYQAKCRIAKMARDEYVRLRDAAGDEF